MQDSEGSSPVPVAPGETDEPVYRLVLKRSARFRRELRIEHDYEVLDVGKGIRLRVIEMDHIWDKVLKLDTFGIKVRTEEKDLLLVVPDPVGVILGREINLVLMEGEVWAR